MQPSYSILVRRLAESLGAFLDPQEARAESRRWLEEGFDCSSAFLAAHGEELVPDAVTEQVAAWLERRRKGEPFAHLLGWAAFRGRRFTVTPETLIPRPETELVVEAALDVGRRLGVRQACDVGTGTGILAITLALETDWTLAASDISEGALKVARANARALGARVAFHAGDLLDALPDPLGLVVSNPPYVDPADEPTLQRELAFEPRQALFAPDRGLALATVLLGQARRRRAPGCILEIGAGQGAELEARARAAGWRLAKVHQDFAGHDRILLALG